MRSTVVVSDILFLFSGVILYWFNHENIGSQRDKALMAIITLLYPGFILIDHGHFQ